VILGALLNTVEAPQAPCPGCGQREAMRVHENGVQWACGHTRGLPPRNAFQRYPRHKSN
jgi:hypothetical protein